MFRYMNDLVLIGSRRMDTLLAMLTGFMIIAVGLTVSAQSFVKGYQTNDPGLRPGMAVVLSDSATAQQQLVERADREDGDAVIGITTTIEESPVTVTSEDDQVYVKNSGVVTAFVSNVNGEVKKGDKVATSPLKGILMRSESDRGVIGVASEDFSSEGAESHSINTDSGEKNVLVAKLAVTLDGTLGRAANHGGSKEPSSLQRLGESVVGKEVGELQVIIALIIFFVMMIAEGGIIYGAVSSSITSLGRNPLAKTIIVRGLVRVLAIVTVVFFVGLAAIYAVLLI